MSTNSVMVAELQGLYGPFAFSELLLQKVWWRREFSAAGARTADGRSVTVLSPGRWNRLGGPDFRDASLEIGGVRVRGDVEVHLRAEDWAAHRHAQDPAYRNVVLHVVLFPPRLPTTTGANGEIPTLVLLPLLWYDLEEYATDEAIASLLNRPEHRIASELTVLPPARLAAVIREAGLQRWKEKVRYAHRRIERLGWPGACHQTALEVLGYRANRATMLQVAEQWPLEAWEAGIDAQQVHAGLAGRWAMQGVRPANHPRQRLLQYQHWVHCRPAWPDRLGTWACALPRALALPEETVTEARQALGYPKAWLELREQVSGDAVAGTRGDNLLGDALLPLVAAWRGDCEPVVRFWWWYGYPGDLPDALRAALRDLGLAGTRTTPATIGAAQGLLGWLLQKESEALFRAEPGVRQGA